jgi:hypothetical protein
MKSPLLWFFCLLIPLGLRAQEFNSGFYTGVVASQLDGDQFEGYNKAGLLFGAYVNRDIYTKTQFQMGLRYIQKGSKKADIKNNVYYKSQLHYVEMPITLKYFYYKKLVFEGGFALGYLIKALEDKDGTGLIAAEPDFNKFEFSGLLGISYFWTEKISFQAHFSYSLLPVRPFFPNYNTIQKGQHNNGVYFTVAYHIASWR